MIGTWGKPIDKADDCHDTISKEREQNRESYDYRKDSLKEEEDTEAERKKLFEYLKEVEGQNQEERRKVQMEDVEEMRKRDIRIKELEDRLKEYRDELKVSLGDELLSVSEIEMFKKEKYCNDLGSENSNLYGGASKTDDFIISTIYL